MNTKSLEADFRLHSSAGFHASEMNTLLLQKGEYRGQLHIISSSRKCSITELQSYLNFHFKVVNVNMLTEAEDINISKRSLRDKLHRGREM